MTITVGDTITIEGDRYRVAAARPSMAPAGADTIVLERMRPAEAPPASLFDPAAEVVRLEQRPPVHAHALAAERRAALAIAPKAGTLRAQVLRFAVTAERRPGQRGITNLEAARLVAAFQLYDEERPDGYGAGDVETRARRILYSIAPRLTELAAGGWLDASDDVREARMVYRATAKALEHVA